MLTRRIQIAKSSLLQINKRNFGGSIYHGIPNQNDTHLNDTNLDQTFFQRKRNYLFKPIDNLFKTDSYLFTLVRKMFL